jgi:hypothetical protein
VLVADIHAVFNGPNGDEDAAVNGFFTAPDLVHPNASGHLAIADTLRTLGYAEVDGDNDGVFDPHSKPDTDADGCEDVVEVANQGVGKPDDPNDPTDVPDADRNGKVEVGDLAPLLTAWNKSPASGSPPYDSRVNFDTRNAKINVGDFSILLHGWNRSCP